MGTLDEKDSDVRNEKQVVGVLQNNNTEAGNVPAVGSTATNIAAQGEPAKEVVVQPKVSASSATATNNATQTGVDDASGARLAIDANTGATTATNNNTEQSEYDRLNGILQNAERLSPDSLSYLNRLQRDPQQLQQMVRDYNDSQGRDYSDALNAYRQEYNALNEQPIKQEQFRSWREQAQAQINADAKAHSDDAESVARKRRTDRARKALAALGDIIAHTANMVATSKGARAMNIGSASEKVGAAIKADDTERAKREALRARDLAAADKQDQAEFKAAQTARTKRQSDLLHAITSLQRLSESGDKAGAEALLKAIQRRLKDEGAARNNTAHKVEDAAKRTPTTGVVVSSEQYQDWISKYGGRVPSGWIVTPDSKSGGYCVKPPKKENPPRAKSKSKGKKSKNGGKKGDPDKGDQNKNLVG